MVNGTEPFPSVRFPWSDRPIYFSLALHTEKKVSLRGWEIIAENFPKSKFLKAFVGKTGKPPIRLYYKKFYDHKLHFSLERNLQL